MKEQKDIFLKNWEAFSKGYPQEAALWRKKALTANDVAVTGITGMDGKPVLQVTDSNNRRLMLDGVYGATERINEQIASWGKIPSRMPIFVVGMSNLEHIRAYLKAANNDCFIMVYEPSLEVFNYVMENILFDDLILDSPVLFIVEALDGESLQLKASRLFKLDTVSSFKLVVSPNYDVLFPEKTMWAIDIMRKRYVDLITTWNTARRYTDVAGLNSMFNIHHIFHGYNVSQLKGMLHGEIPAFVISAGPSLNKNIDELREAKGKACLIAVDTAIKPLLNRGIVPDFFVIVDGKKPTDLMAHPRISEVPLVTSGVVASGIMDLHKGKKFFSLSDDSLELEYFERGRKEAGLTKTLYEQDLPTGGSVANTAFSLAKIMDASQIVFVGQDLALTNGRTHADGTFKDKMQKLSSQEMGNTIEVEGIRGNMVLTRPDFYMYLKWFEEQIEIYKMTNIYDATQGGAKIHGTKVLTLKSAIKRFCTQEIDMQQKIEELPEMLDWSAKREFVRFYKELPDRMREVHQKAKKGEELYTKLEKVASKKVLAEKEYVKLVKQIEKINNFMNTDNYALFVQDNLMDLNFIMRMAIYEEEENERDDRISLAKQGRIMNHYIKLESEQWIPIAGEILERFPVEATEDDIQNSLDKLLYDIEQVEVTR